VPIGGARDRARQVLHAEVRRHADELTWLDVGPEADEQVGESLEVGAAVAHRSGA
jgi:hypothetical protein